MISLMNFTGIVVGLFLGIHFLFLDFRNNWANLYLGVFFLITGFSIAGSEELVLEALAEPYHWLFVCCSPFLVAPVLLKYAVNLTQSQSKIGALSNWIWLPAGLDIALNLIFFGNEMVATWTILLSSIFSLWVYAMILMELRKHAQTILNLFSTLEDKRLHWLRLLVMVNVGFSLLWLVDDGVQMIAEGNVLSMALSEFSTVATLITVLWMGFAGLRQPLIYPQTEEVSVFPEVLQVVQSEIANQYQDIVAQIEERKLYLDRELSLSGLGGLLGLKSKELSQIINQGSGENFYHFINRFRVAHFKAALHDQAHESMSFEGLSYEAGFKSKSTFYAAFKKMEEKTPKQYLKALNE